MASYVTIKVFAGMPEFTGRTHFHAAQQNTLPCLICKKSTDVKTEKCQRKTHGRSNSSDGGGDGGGDSSNNLWTTHHSELLLANKDNIVVTHTCTPKPREEEEEVKKRRRRRMLACSHSRCCCFFLLLLALTTTFETYRNISASLANWFQLDASVRCALIFSDIGQRRERGREKKLYQ